MKRIESSVPYRIDRDTNGPQWMTPQYSITVGIVRNRANRVLVASATHVQLCVNFFFFFLTTLLGDFDDMLGTPVLFFATFLTRSFDLYLLS